MGWQGAAPAYRRATRRMLGAIAAAVLVTSLAGCGGSSSAASGTRVDVTMKDFAFTVSRPTVPAGTVVLHVTNEGPSTHEIIVDVSKYDSGDLPLEEDGLTANEDAKGLRRVGSIEQVDLHHTADLTLELKPGHYVLWCNLEGHYLGGMHVSLDVR